MALITEQDNLPRISGAMVSRPELARNTRTTPLRLKLDAGGRSWYVIEAIPERDVMLAYAPDLDELGFYSLSALEARSGAEKVTRDEVHREIPLEDVIVKRAR